MKKFKLNKKVISILAGFTLIMEPIIANGEVIKSYEYSDGTVYIVDTKLDRSYILDNDIVVLDQRSSTDPNMKIYDSYRINSSDKMKEVIRILMNYEKEYPSRWNRSEASLLREWQIHNSCYFNGYELNRTRDADLNNGDERIYGLISGVFDYNSDYVGNEETMLFDLLGKDYSNYYENGHELYRGLVTSYNFFHDLYGEEIDNSELVNDPEYKLMLEYVNNFERYSMQSKYASYDYYTLSLPGYMKLYNKYIDRVRTDCTRSIDYSGNISEEYSKQITRIYATLSLIKTYNFDLNIDSALRNEIETSILNLGLSYVGNLLDIDTDFNDDLIKDLNSQINYYNCLIDSCYKSYAK